MEFLGDWFDFSGIRSLPSKVQAIKDFLRPTSNTKLRQFLGLVNFYRRFVPNCAQLLEHFENLLTKQERQMSSLPWNEEAERAFGEVKNSLAEAAMLVHPMHDAPTSLMTDLSATAIGAVLEQKVDGEWRPIGFFSKTLNPAQTRYRVFGRQLLAAYLALRHFRHFVEGRPFTIWTDHKPLTYAICNSESHYAPRDFRQLAFLAEFTNDIRHVKGVDNVPADLLSRIDAVNTPPFSAVNLESLARLQTTDEELRALHNSTTSLQLTEVSFQKVPPCFAIRQRESLELLYRVNCDGNFWKQFIACRTRVYEQLRSI